MTFVIERGKLVLSYGVDIGGSGIKGAPVNLSTGSLTAKRYRVSTPEMSTPQIVCDLVREIVEHHGWDGPLGVAIPCVVVNGVVRTAANIDDGWVGVNAQKMMSERLNLPVTVVNDADAAGLAETRFGDHDNRVGVTIVLTFGTGIGSALINNGELVPNTELGHLEFRGHIAEEYAAGRLVKRGELDIKWWAERVNEYLEHVERIFSPERIIVGGGISKRFEEFSHLIETHSEVVAARLRNNAGIVGAAMTATPGS